MPQYPEVVVKLVGEDGNAFAILGRVQKALRRAGASDDELDTFRHDATAGDYNHLLGVVEQWVTTE